MSDKNVGIAVIRKPLSVLTAENVKYRNGQFIIAVDGLGREGVKVGSWIKETTPESAAEAFNDRPWLIKPESSGSAGFTPWKVRNGDTTMAGSGDDMVITDPRLIGVTDPIVSCTKDGREYRDNEITVNSTDGILTLIGFYTMEDTEHITIIVPTKQDPASDILSLISRLEKVEIYTKPVAMGGAIYIFNKPVSQIPIQYQEVTEFAGKFIAGYLKTSADFGDIGVEGGSNTHTLTLNEMPPHDHDLEIPSRDLTNYGAEGPDLTADPDTTVNDKRLFKTKKTGGVDDGTGTGNKVAAPFKTIPAFKLVAFIELKPEYQIS